MDPQPRRPEGRPGTARPGRSANSGARRHSGLDVLGATTTRHENETDTTRGNGRADARDADHVDAGDRKAAAVRTTAGAAGVVRTTVAAAAAVVVTAVAATFVVTAVRTIVGSVVVAGAATLTGTRRSRRVGRVAATTGRLTARIFATRIFAARVLAARIFASGVLATRVLAARILATGVLAATARLVATAAGLVTAATARLIATAGLIAAAGLVTAAGLIAAAATARVVRVVGAGLVALIGGLGDRVAGRDRGLVEHDDTAGVDLRGGRSRGGRPRESRYADGTGNDAEPGYGTHATTARELIGSHVPPRTSD
ncbi:hypothetical protein [Pseudosporangium ferrugineum]|uniref:hypothetical protein n=1 Tax=Pseudosporangium ferrugineum TaxID=439699 RepID=UPI0011B23390|nr:hypothetical protein [Pseudosporangium ferrugineum]